MVTSCRLRRSHACRRTHDTTVDMTQIKRKDQVINKIGNVSRAWFVKQW